MAAEFYMFFDKEKLPIAVFLADSNERATYLFAVMSRKSWDRCVVEDGVSVSKETDVPVSEWERIAKALKLPPFKIQIADFEEEPDYYGLIQYSAMRYARKHYLERKGKKTA